VSSPRLLGPVAMACVLAVALVVGSGAFDAPAPALSTRISSLERIVRAPSATDLSVAQNNAPSSIAIRDEIARQVRGGRTDAQILDALEARYGTSILLVPPAGGLDTLLWALPLALALAAVAGGAAVVVRRRRS